ncbi:MAG: TIGR01212 family radical SAM protein [Candidatus Tantalella remota]|nr:TIGR01212 family radical SAM protein [Candidatus Tantalella remota]
MSYYLFSKYLKEQFGQKVRRISLDAGFTCPNRDSSGGGGCIYCNELGFIEAREKVISLKEQIEEGILIARKKGVNRFMAYFQNATSTNAPVEELKKAYDSIIGYDDIVALSISTRPDCVEDVKLDLITGYAKDRETWIEYGLQTIHNRTLERIGRGHTFEQTKDAIERTAARGIKVGVHVILGLSGESREDMIATAREVSRLPVNGVKLHVFQVLSDTPLEKMYADGEIDLMTRDEYVAAACDFLENISADRVILRLVSDSREEYLIGPEWTNDKLSVIAEVKKEFASRGTYQGSSSTV